MVTSPTGRGVVVVGGIVESPNGSYSYSHLIELSGETKETLRWKKLTQKLQYPRKSHISFPIPTQTVTCSTPSTMHSNGEHMH